MSSPTDPSSNRESVRNYPRPPALEPASRPVRIVFNETMIADTTDALRVLETNHPPTYYVPPADVATTHLERSRRTTLCEFKGRAVYYTVTVGPRSAQHAAWSYPDPPDRYADLAGYVAFYPRPMDACYVGEERVRPQEGTFYGGWITDDLKGPFTGHPDTSTQ